MSVVTDVINIYSENVCNLKTPIKEATTSMVNIDNNGSKKIPPLLINLEQDTQSGNVNAVLQKLRLLLETMQNTLEYEQGITRQKQRQLEQGIHSLDVLQRELLQSIRNLRLLKRHQKAVAHEQYRTECELQRLQVKEKIAMEKKIKEVEKPLLLRYRNIKCSEDANKLLAEINAKRHALELLETLVIKRSTDFNMQDKNILLKKLKKRKAKSKTEEQSWIGDSIPNSNDNSSNEIVINSNACVIDSIQGLLMGPLQEISIVDLTSSEISHPLNLTSFTEINVIDPQSIQTIVNDLNQNSSHLPFESAI